MKITKKYNLAKLIYKYPQTSEILLDYGLHCVGCMASSYDTIEQGAKIHGLTDKEIKEMIIKVNKVINYKE